MERESLHKFPKKLLRFLRKLFPRISGREVVNSLGKVGYEVDRQRGSHIILRNGEPPHLRLTIPDHDEVAKGTLRSIIRQAGLSVDEFKALL
jgi:predicted RNA binding protein YcfA (HicA-like mRNA interferase family)